MFKFKSKNKKTHINLSLFVFKAFKIREQFVFGVKYLGIDIFIITIHINNNNYNNNNNNDNNNFIVIFYYFCYYSVVVVPSPLSIYIHTCMHSFCI